MTTPHISGTTKIILIVEFVLLSYMLYVLSTSLYKSYQVDRFISAAEEQNKKLEEANTALADDYEYYRSDAYKEKIAKQNFGLVRPGEEVIVLTKDGSAGLSLDDNAGQITTRYSKSMSNPQKWFFFFFDRERFSL